MFAILASDLESSYLNPQDSTQTATGSLSLNALLLPSSSKLTGEASVKKVRTTLAGARMHDTPLLID